MTVREYIDKVGASEYQELTFVVGTYSNNLPQYRSTPIRTIQEWGNASVMNYIVLNYEQPHASWLSGVDWNPAIRNHRLMSLLVIDQNQLIQHYSKEQLQSMVQFIDKKIDESIEYYNPWKKE